MQHQLVKAAIFPCYLQEAIYLVHYHANEKDFCIAGRKRAGKIKGSLRRKKYPEETHTSSYFHLSHVQRQYEDPGVSLNPILKGRSVLSFVIFAMCTYGSA